MLLMSSMPPPTPRKSCLFEPAWKNIVEAGRPQMTI